VIGLLQSQRRVTYRTLTYIFGLDEAFLHAVCEDLRFRRLAHDEEGKGLVWTGAMETPAPGVPPVHRDLADTNTITDTAATSLPPHMPEVEILSTRQAMPPEALSTHVLQDKPAITLEPLRSAPDAERRQLTVMFCDADYGVQVAVRIGIHTGPVVVGKMGGGGRHENLALGEAPNIAARLEGLAPSNTVVMSPVTAHLVQRAFILEELGPHALKGVVEPMMIYTVVTPRETDHDDHEAMIAGGFDALVGRDEEIGLLLRRWEQSKDGFGQVVLIRGEAGIGKSSLVEGLRGHVRAEGRTRLAFRGSPHTTSALYPIIEHVQRSLDWQPEDTVDTRLAKLERGLESSSLALEEAVPLLTSLFSLPLPADRYPALSLSPQQQRQHIQDVLVTWLLEKAERQPVLAVWEDLHWADPSTVEALGLLMDQAPTVAMLHVLTFRPEFVPPWPARSHMTPLTLNRLECLQSRP
jgi:hypothetical protein